MLRDIEVKMRGPGAACRYGLVAVLCLLACFGGAWSGELPGTGLWGAGNGGMGTCLGGFSRSLAAGCGRGEQAGILRDVLAWFLGVVL